MVNRALDGFSQTTSLRLPLALPYVENFIDQ